MDNSIQKIDKFKTYLLILIFITIIINLTGIILPTVRNDDPLVYANIVKNMALNSDWINLFFRGQDWLDKPHFPFWITLLSFKIFGIKYYAYIIPGFIFHLIGAYYTYKLASVLYNKNVGLISTAIYLSSLHLLISSIDVRAEAYLLGSIIPACYYWYKYEQLLKINLKYLLLGTLFTSVALMTKGPFVILVIYAGVLVKIIFNNQGAKLFSLQWVLAIILPFIFIFPEYLSLYLQFDMHPEKNIHGHYATSGIKWFLWDSQFGRFFNEGPIIVNHVQPLHYLYFIHTYIWSFLPWSFILIFICIGKFIRNKSNNILFLCGSFIPAFIIFSLTKFQLDHYINILIPFTSILCGDWIFKAKQQYSKVNKYLVNLQIYFCYFILIMINIVSILILNINCNLLNLFLSFCIISCFFMINKRNYIEQMFIKSILVFNLLFILILQINNIYIEYDLGYQVATKINNIDNATLLTYKIDSQSLDFYIKKKYIPIDNLNNLYNYKGKYLLISENNLKIKNKFKVINVIYATTIDKLINNIFHLSHKVMFTEKYLLINIKS